MKKPLYFVSSNPHKIAETKGILATAGVEVKPLTLKIEELQIVDMNAIAQDKVMKAFREIGRPLFVEHTGLFIEHLNGFPGGLTQVFWDSLGADKVAALIGNCPNPTTIARTTVAYVDGRQIHEFEGQVSGRISPRPHGIREFQWDCVFIPEGYTLTFSELGERKNEISMRRRALEQFARFLRDEP